MRILHVLASNSFSGAENVVCQIINVFKTDSNIDMAYCSPDGAIRNALEERDVQFFSIKNLCKKELKKAIEAYKPDIIHAHDMKASFVVSYTCGKIPFVSHIHNNAYNSRGISLKAIAYYFAGRRAKHIFWVSKSAYSGYAFYKRFEAKSSVLYNIIDYKLLYERASADNDDYFYDIVFVGRLTYPKNPQRLIKVINDIVKISPNTKAAIVGKGELDDEIASLVYEYGLQDNVKLLGFMNNPLKLMKDSKMMLMTSRWEGLPMCVIEAMLLGVPIVSTPVDGMKEIVDDSMGFLSEEDRDLVAHAVDILNNPELRSSMSINCINKAREICDIPKYRKELMDVYRNIKEWDAKKP